MALLLQARISWSLSPGAGGWWWSMDTNHMSCGLGLGARRCDRRAGVGQDVAVLIDGLV